MTNTGFALGHLATQSGHAGSMQRNLSVSITQSGATVTLIGVKNARLGTEKKPESFPESLAISIPFT